MGVGGQPHATATCTTGEDTVPILQEAGCAPEPFWTGGISRPHRDLIPDRPARSQSLYRPSYSAHTHRHKVTYNGETSFVIIVCFPLCILVKNLADDGRNS